MKVSHHSQQGAEPRCGDYPSLKVGLSQAVLYNPLSRLDAIAVGHKPHFTKALGEPGSVLRVAAPAVQAQPQPPVLPVVDPPPPAGNVEQAGLGAKPAARTTLRVGCLIPVIAVPGIRVHHRTAPSFFALR